MTSSLERSTRSIDHTSAQPARPSQRTGRSGRVGERAPDTRWLGMRPPEPVDPDLPVPTADMPRKGVRVARRRRLLRVAGTQRGLFTTAQAAEAGLDRRARHHHLAYGNWRRTAAPKVFRIAGWPPDEHERLRAWVLWAGPGAHLTAFTALGLAGLIGTGPRVPVDLEIPCRNDREGVRRRHVLLHQLEAADASDAVRLHRSVTARSDVIDGLVTRPPAEAICAAINEHPDSVAVGLLEALVDRGLLSRSDLFRATHSIRCGPVMELLFARRAG